MLTADCWLLAAAGRGDALRVRARRRRSGRAEGAAGGGGDEAPAAQVRCVLGAPSRRPRSDSHCAPSSPGIAEDEELHQYVVYDSASDAARKGPRRINLDDPRAKAKGRSGAYAPPTSLLVHLSKIDMPELRPRVEVRDPGPELGWVVDDVDSGVGVGLGTDRRTEGGSEEIAKGKDKDRDKDKEQRKTKPSASEKEREKAEKRAMKGQKRAEKEHNKGEFQTRSHVVARAVSHL